MKNDGEVLVDVDGRVRLPENVRIAEDSRTMMSDKKPSNRKARQFADLVADKMFQATGKIIGVKELDETFQDYDDRKGIKKKHIIYTDEECRELLKNLNMKPEELITHLQKTCGTERSVHAIIEKTGYISREFENWKEQNQEMIEGLTHEEIVELYI